MARESVNVIYKLCPILRHRRSAHAPAYLNFDAGRLALKRPQHQQAVLHQVKAGPVEVRQGVVQQRSGIGEVCGLMGHPVDEGG